jgi:hypothetical protein
MRSLAARSSANGNSPSENINLTRVIRYLELHLHSKSSIDGLAQEFSIKRRCLYDFLSICSTLGICRRLPSNTVEWLGLTQSHPMLQSIRLECRQEDRDRDLKEMFDYSLDASLQRIAVAVIKLFYVLRVKYLDLRKVSRLFAQRNLKYKTMLRKLYTVTGGLELAQIVRKTAMVSEIQLLVPLDIESDPTKLKLSGMLNTREELEEQRISDKRRVEFEQLCSELARAKPAELDRRLQFPSLLQPFSSWTSPFTTAW